MKIQTQVQGTCCNVLASEVVDWLRVFRRLKHCQRWCGESSCSPWFHWRAFTFLRRSWHVLVARLIEGRVELVVENKVTRSGTHPSRRTLIEQLPRRTLIFLLCELKYGGQVKHLSPPRSIWCEIWSRAESYLSRYFRGSETSSHERHPKLLHPSADDSKIFDRYLNGISQNGKCLVNVPCDSWSMIFSGAVESVKGS
jgi:hypothetical protein